MKDEPEADSDAVEMLPVWARDEAFGSAPEGYGWMDKKGGKHPCGSLEELRATIRGDKTAAVALVWTPDSEFCRVPEEVADFDEAMLEVRRSWVLDDLDAARFRLKRLGIGLAILVGYMVFRLWNHVSEVERINGISLDFVAKVGWLLRALMGSTAVGIGLLVFLIFAFIPWYQARKRSRELAGRGGVLDLRGLVPVLRFETWLERQKGPVTMVILVMILCIGVLQMFYENSVQAAGLVKDRYAAGEWWRLFTAPLLHGGLLHLLMNAAALMYLGRRLEVFARWPHLALVFVFAACVGGEASAWFSDATSVGASGGLMGWLGFLLVFETLHSRLVPLSAKRRLLGGVILTGLIGLVGYRFIDNAAHAGGLVAGMMYAAIVFPRSGSALRPRPNATDRVLGGVALGVMFIAGLWAVMKMI